MGLLDPEDAVARIVLRERNTESVEPRPEHWMIRKYFQPDLPEVGSAAGHIFGAAAQADPAYQRLIATQKQHKSEYQEQDRYSARDRRKSAAVGGVIFRLVFASGAAFMRKRP